MKALTEQGFPGYTLGTEIAASLISFSQVLGSFVEMRIDWPKDLERALSQLNINRYLSLDLTGFQCRLPSNFYKRYYMVVITIMSIVSLFGILALGSRWCIRESRDQQVFKMITLKAVIFVLFFFYPFFCSRLLLAFPCRRIYEITYLMHDYSEECFSAAHVQLLVVGGAAGLAGFVFGVPLFFYCCMVRFKIPDIVREKRRDTRAANLLLYFASRDVMDAPLRALGRDSLDDRAVDTLHEFFICGSELDLGQRLATTKEWIDQSSGGGETDDCKHKGDEGGGGGEAVRTDCLSVGKQWLKVAYEPRSSMGVCESEPENGTKDSELALLSELSNSAATPSEHLGREAKLAELMEFAKGPEMEKVDHFQLKWQIHRSIWIRKRTEMRTWERDALVHIGFLFAAYKPEYWFFELLETFRKLVFVAIPVLLDEPGEQLLNSMVVCLLYVACLHCCQPNSSGLNRTVKITCAYVLLMNNFYGWMMLAGLVDAAGEEDSFSMGLVVMNNFAFFGPALVSMFIMLSSLHSMYTQRKRNQESTSRRQPNKDDEASCDADIMAGD
eukprot:gene7241-8625_t